MQGAGERTIETYFRYVERESVDGNAADELFQNRLLMNAASIDIGSNTVLLLIAAPVPGEKIAPLIQKPRSLGWVKC